MKAFQIEGGRIVRAAAADPGRGFAEDAGPFPIQVMDESEFIPPAGDRVVHEVLRQLPHASVPFAERAPEGVVGLLALPAPERGGLAQARVLFVLGRDSLSLVGEPEACMRALGDLAEESVPVPHAASVLCELMHRTVRDHPAMLSEVRRDFELLEERLLEGRGRIDRALLMSDSRRLLGLDALYQGMSDMASELADEGDDLVGEADRQRFRALGRQLDRLSARLESLQDHSLQLHSLYQEGIDIRQNSVMQWLTVIATIFMPLTFITSWYGMNFPNMGMTRVPWGYVLVIAVCALVAALEVLFFHRRGWLHFGGGKRVRSGTRRGRRGRSERSDLW